MYYTYILKCADNSYYVGSTENITERLKMHNSGKGAHFTSKRKPSVLVYLQPFNNKSQALLRELEIKKFSRIKKEKLIFRVGTIWKHYRSGDKYIIIDIIDDIIVYGEHGLWQEYIKKQEKPGYEFKAWIRSKSQWLDWIDKEKKLLRFNLVTAE